MSRGSRKPPSFPKYAQFHIFPCGAEIWYNYMAGPVRNWPAWANRENRSCSAVVPNFLFVLPTFLFPLIEQFIGIRACALVCATTARLLQTINTGTVAFMRYGGPGLRSACCRSRDLARFFTQLDGPLIIYGPRIIRSWKKGNSSKNGTKKPHGSIGPGS